jgi:hypothetical protein
MRCSTLFLIFAAAAQPLFAGIIGADFTETLDFPGFPFLPGGPRVARVTGVVLPQAGTLLSAANVISNPTGYNQQLNVSFDAVTDILSLTPDHANNYQYIQIDLTNLLFDNGSMVTGIVALSTGNAVVGKLGAPYEIDLSFTGNSAQVLYRTAAAYSAKDQLQMVEQGVDTFQLTLATSTPEPAGASLIAGGLVAIWLRRRASRERRAVSLRCLREQSRVGSSPPSPHHFQ